MTAIRITKFLGEATGVTPRQIPEGFARKALNADVIKGTLRPALGLLATAENSALASAETIYRYPNGKWLAWAADVDVVRSPLVDDAWSRIYWTGDGVPKVAAVDTATAGVAPYPNEGYNLGVPAPSNIVTVADPGGAPPSVIVTVLYAIAYVTAYDEVGPLSDPSAPATRWDGGGDPTLTITNESLPNSNIDRVRIFRSEGGGSYNFVTDLAIGTTSYVDDVQSEDLLGDAISIDWDQPDSNLQGLMSGPGGSLYGFFENKLCASEPGYPHAWPVGYRLTMQDDIVAIAESAAGIVVATKGMPVVVVGSTPSALAPIKIESMESCLSKRSMVDMGDYVVYASPNGLVGIGGQGASLMTEPFLEREEWQQINPASIHAYRDRDRYLAFYTDLSAQSGCFTFSPKRGFEFMEITAQAGHFVGEDDTLYIHDGNTLLKAWDAGAALQLNWQSGLYEMQPGTSFTCGKVVAAGYPVTLKFHADGVEVFQVTVTSNGMFRLPAGYSQAREWSFELISDYEIFSLQVAQSPSELV